MSEPTKDSRIWTFFLGVSTLIVGAFVYGLIEAGTIKNAINELQKAKDQQTPINTQVIANREALRSLEKSLVSIDQTLLRMDERQRQIQNDLRKK